MPDFFLGTVRDSYVTTRVRVLYSTCACTRVVHVPLPYGDTSILYGSTKVLKYFRK